MHLNIFLKMLVKVNVTLMDEIHSSIKKWREKISERESLAFSQSHPSLWVGDDFG